MVLKAEWSLMGEVRVTLEAFLSTSLKPGAPCWAQQELGGGCSSADCGQHSGASFLVISLPSQKPQRRLLPATHTLHPSTS